MPERDGAVAQLIRRRLRAVGISARQASLRARLSHNTLRVVLAGARPSGDTCDALDAPLELVNGTLRLLAGWQLPSERYLFSEEWARTLLELSQPEDRQKLIGYLLAQAPRPARSPDESA